MHMVDCLRLCCVNCYFYDHSYVASDCDIPRKKRPKMFTIYVYFRWYLHGHLH